MRSDFELREKKLIQLTSEQIRIVDFLDDQHTLLEHELALYQRLIPGVRKQMERHGVIYPSGLWGMSLLNNLSETSLIHLIEEIPEGTWELMVHPGYPDLDSPFSGPERLKELKALASPRIRKLLKTRNIQKTTFRDLV